MEQANHLTNNLFAKLCAKKTRLAVALTAYTVLTLLNYIIFTIGEINLKSIGVAILFLAFAYGVWRGSRIAMAVSAGMAARSAVNSAILVFSSHHNRWFDITFMIASVTMIWMLLKEDSANRSSAIQK